MLRRTAQTGHERDLDICIFKPERASARRHWTPISRSESEEHALGADICLPLLVRAALAMSSLSLSAAQKKMRRVGGLRPRGRKSCPTDVSGILYVARFPFLRVNIEKH